MTTPDTLAAWTLAAMIETELLHLEIGTGHNLAGTRRPLNRAERRATTRFGDIDTHVTQATDRARPLIGRLLRAGTEAVLNHVFPLGADALAATAAAELAGFGAQIGARAAETLAEVVPEIRDTLTASWRFGAETVLEELGRQGVPAVAEWRIPDAPSTIETLANHIATHPLLRQLEIASRYVADPFRTLGMQVTRAEVENLLAATSDAGSVDVMHQGVQSVLSMGRVATVEAAGADRFLVAYASAILDRSVCSACAAGDGRRYETLAAAKAEFPTGGRLDCAGGPRCRCLLIYVLEDPGAAGVPLPLDSAGIPQSPGT